MSTSSFDDSPICTCYHTLPASIPHLPTCDSIPPCSKDALWEDLAPLMLGDDEAISQELFAIFCNEQEDTTLAYPIQQNPDREFGVTVTNIMWDFGRESEYDGNDESENGSDSGSDSDQDWDSDCESELDDEYEFHTRSESTSESDEEIEGFRAALKALEPPAAAVKFPELVRCDSALARQDSAFWELARSLESDTESESDDEAVDEVVEAYPAVFGPEDRLSQEERQLVVEASREVEYARMMFQGQYNAILRKKWAGKLAGYSSTLREVRRNLAFEEEMKDLKRKNCEV